VLADDDDPSVDAPRVDRDPLDALLEPGRGWRARLAEMTGGLGDLPSTWPHPRTGLRSTAFTIAAIAVVLVALVIVAAITGVLPIAGRDGAGTPSASIELPRAGTTSSRPQHTSAADEQASGTAVPGIWVAAAGAVSRTGLYRLRPDARVSELLIAAGGLTADADADRINLAAVLRDGQRLYVPRRGEAAVPTIVTGDGGEPAGGGPGGGGPGGGTPPTSPVPSREHPIDINTATADELDQLPGVGPATAAAIIDHRTKHGPFTSVDDLRLVHGIGPAKLAQLRELVRV